MRSPAALDPSGAPSRKSSGWIVPKTEMRGAGTAVRRPCLRSWRFEDEPQNHRGDSKRNRADPQVNQYVPHVHPTLPVAQRPTATHVPRRRRNKHADCGNNRSEIAARIVRTAPAGGVIARRYACFYERLTHSRMGCEAVRPARPSRWSWARSEPTATAPNRRVKDSAEPSQWDNLALCIPQFPRCRHW